MMKLLTGLRYKIDGLTQHWYSNKRWLYTLWPLSFCYRLAVALRYSCYRLKILSSKRFSIPIIIVGNITTGGTGKTPLVIWLAHYLREKGYSPGIVTRGYSGKSSFYPRTVSADCNPEEVGDEAVLLAQKTACPVVIDRNRPNAVAKLLAENACNIIISDDGLQHYALERDIEIAVIDGTRRLGNGLCLPAGPLREPPFRLKKVDFVVSNGVNQANEHAMQLLVGQIIQLNNPMLSCSTTHIKQKTIHAIAGIGNPTRFFDLLKSLGLTIVEHVFPDHYKFRATDIDFGADALVIMTEKDAVKCRSFADERHWVLPIYAHLSENFAEELLEKIKIKGTAKT